MLYNGKSVEIFTDQSGNSLSVPPRCVFGYWNGFDQRYPQFNSDITVSERLRGASSILVIRRYALGDTLMLLPVLRQLRDQYPNIKTLTLLGSKTILDSGLPQEFGCGIVDRFIPDTSWNFSAYDVAFLVDGVVEQDHTIGWCQHTPRVDLFRIFFELSLREPLNWDCHSLSSGWKNVVFCSSGNKPQKTVPKVVADSIAEKLARKFPDFYHTGAEKRVPYPELFSMMVNAKALVTVDTSLLWIAHFTKTPVVFLHGPTRPNERLVYHPLQPDGCVSIDLAKASGCSPCYEGMQKCSNQARCFTNVDEKWLYDGILEGIRSVSWKTR
jgi:hypothetical protein